MTAPDYARRLRLARERTGKSIEEMAGLLNTTWESYNDLESHDDELLDTTTLDELVSLSAALDLDLVEFLSDDSSRPSGPCGLHALAAKVKEYLEAHRLTVAAFEDQVGWEVEKCLADPDEFGQYTVTALKDLCRPLGINWLAVLSALRRDA